MFAINRYSVIVVESFIIWNPWGEGLWRQMYVRLDRTRKSEHD